MSRGKQVNTARVDDFRRLWFDSIQDLRREVDRIVAADAAGTLRCAGNWTAGQTFGHLSTWIDFGYEGFPFRVPWFIRFLVRRQMRSYMKRGLPRGVRIPRGPKEGTWGTELISTEQGARRLHASLDRLAREPAKFHSPAFGRLTEQERIALNLRHAELHLGYLHP